MKNLFYKISLISVISGLLFTFHGCKDDTVSPNTPSPPITNDSLLFSLDSLSEYAPPYQGGKTIYFEKPDTIPAYNVRIQFTVQGFTQNGYIYFSVLSTDEFCNYISGPDSAYHNMTSPVNYNYNYVTSYFPYCKIEFKVHANCTSQNYPAWIKIKNVRVYKSQF